MNFFISNSSNSSSNRNSDTMLKMVLMNAGIPRRISMNKNKDKPNKVRRSLVIPGEIIANPEPCDKLSTSLTSVTSTTSTTGLTSSASISMTTSTPHLNMTSSTSFEANPKNDKMTSCRTSVIMTSPSRHVDGRQQFAQDDTCLPDREDTSATRPHKRRCMSGVSGTKVNLKRRLTINPSWRVGNREVRRTKSFSSQMEGGEDVERPMTPQETPTYLRKRHKPLIVKKVSVAELADKQTTSGYMERKSLSAQWIKATMSQRWTCVLTEEEGVDICSAVRDLRRYCKMYWYVLHEGTLFCYLTPDDTVSVDVLNLHGYSVICMVDKFRGKRFVLQLAHDNFTSLYLSMDSREEMDHWQGCLEKGLTQPSSTAKDGLEVVVEAGSTVPEATKSEDVEEKRKQVKQKLLQEMLRQKHELERKQAERHRKQQRNSCVESPDRSPSSPLPPEFTSDEQRTSDVTRLRQRRMSTQLKYETIQKQMSKPMVTKRGLFGFGKAKKTDENKNEYLQDQLKELNTKLHKIDNDLCQVKSQEKLGDGYDVNQNRMSLSSTLPPDMFSQKYMEITDDADTQKNGGTKFKSTVQKWTNKTFNKTSTKKKSGVDSKIKHNASVPDLGAKTNGEVTVNGHSHDYESDGNTEECHSIESNSFTDLTRPMGDLKLDLHIAHAQPVLNGSPRYSRSNSRGSTISNLSSPRREIDPSVLAEIEAFEQLTKQVLGARSKELPGK